MEPEIRLTLSRVGSFGADIRVVTLTAYASVILMLDNGLKKRFACKVEVDDVLFECQLVPVLKYESWIVKKIQDVQINDRS